MSLKYKKFISHSSNKKRSNRRKMKSRRRKNTRRKNTRLRNTRQMKSRRRKNTRRKNTRRMKTSRRNRLFKSIREKMRGGAPFSGDMTRLMEDLKLPGRARPIEEGTEGNFGSIYYVTSDSDALTLFGRPPPEEHIIKVVTPHKTGAYSNMIRLQGEYLTMKLLTILTCHDNNSYFPRRIESPMLCADIFSIKSNLLKVHFQLPIRHFELYFCTPTKPRRLHGRWPWLSPLIGVRQK